MTIQISQIYQKRKIVYVYLDTNEETQNLKKQAGDKVLLHLGTWQMWGERAVEDAWKNKTHDWIIWPHQTSRLNRWVVLVINVKDNKSAIHTGSQDTEHAKAEKDEIKNFLEGLEDFSFSDENPILDTDDGLNKKDELGSACLAICYVKTVLEQLNKGNYTYDINSSDFDELGEGGKSLLKKVEEEYESILTQVRKLTKLEELEKKVDQLGIDGELIRTEKEKYQKEDLNGQAWTLTASEKTRIDQATNQQDLAEAVRKIMEERKVNQWIKDNITDQTKAEALPSETDIDNAAELPANVKEQAKWKLQEKQIELMPANTTEEKIKKHLTEAKFKWGKWLKLVQQKNETDRVDYSLALMFNEEFGPTVAPEMLPKITAALAENTLKGYQKLDQEWGLNLMENGQVKYNEDRDYYEFWKTLREYLNQQKANQDAWMKAYLSEVYGADKFQEYEKLYHDLLTQIEIQNK